MNLIKNNKISLSLCLDWAEKIWDHSSGNIGADFYHRYKVIFYLKIFNKFCLEFLWEKKALYLI